MCLDKPYHLKYHVSSSEIMNERGVMLLFLHCHATSEQHCPFSTLPLLIHWGLSWLLRRVRGSGGRLVCSSVNSVLRVSVIWLLKGEADYSRGVFEKPVPARNGWQEKAQWETKKSCWQCLWCSLWCLDTGFCSWSASHKDTEMPQYK